MVSINEVQIQNIAKSIIDVSVKEIHLDRKFLTCEGTIEAKLVAYMICSTICHQTHNLIKIDENLIGWQYIESVFTKLISNNDELLSLDYLKGHTIIEIAQYLEKLFPKSDIESISTLENSDERAALLKGIVNTLNERGINSLFDFFNLYSEERVLNVKSIYSELSSFKAYADPYKKKSTLLLKLINQSGIYELDNRSSLEPMMDYHMQRLLLRTGCVKIENKNLKNQLKGRLRLSSDEIIRETCIKAIKKISEHSNKSIFDLDDIFWSIGRSCCKEKVLCVDGKCNKTPCTFVQLTNVKEHIHCIFDDCCLGKIDETIRELWEPNVQTEYY